MATDKQGILLWEPRGAARARDDDALHALARGRARSALRRLRRAVARGRPRSSRRSGPRSGSSSTSRRATTRCSPTPRCRARSGSPAPSSPTRSTSSATGPATAWRSATPPSCATLGEWTWDELREQTARVAAGLRAMGIERGDRVVAYMPNIPETIAAFLAVASLGAVWSSCSPDFGARTRRRPLRPDRAEGAADRRRLPLRRQGPRPRRADRAASRARCPRSSAR